MAEHLTILGIDPGPERSAWLTLVDGKPAVFGIDDNDDVVFLVGAEKQPDILAIEMIACYGMAVGKSVFETCVWIGRFWEASNCDVVRIYRKAKWGPTLEWPGVCMTLCHNNRAKDSNIRQALIDRFGPGKDKAIGLKKNPGPLYGIKKDIWSALAVAVTCWEHWATGRSD